MSLPDPRERPLLRPDELALFFPDMGRSARYEAIRRGDIPSIRIGARIYIPTARLLTEVFGISSDMSEAPPEPGEAIATNITATRDEVRRVHHTPTDVA